MSRKGHNWDSALGVYTALSRIQRLSVATLEGRPKRAIAVLAH